MRNPLKTIIYTAMLMTITAILAACGGSTYWSPDPEPTSDPNYGACDHILKRQLAFQRAATTSAQIQTIITEIQTLRSDLCGQELWNPIVDDTTAFHQCWRGSPPTRRTQADNTVGDLEIPSALYEGPTNNDTVRLKFRTGWTT